MVKKWMRGYGTRFVLISRMVDVRVVHWRLVGRCGALAVHRFVVDQDGEGLVFDQVSNREHCVQRLGRRVAEARGRVDDQSERAEFGVGCRVPLQHERPDSAAGASADRVRAQQSLGSVAFLHLELQLFLDHFNQISAAVVEASNKHVCCGLFGAEDVTRLE